MGSALFQLALATINCRLRNILPRYTNITARTIMSSPAKDDSTNPKKKYEYKPTSHHFQPRYAGPPPGEMTPEQSSLSQSILASRPRTGLSGPFGPWLAVPAIAQPSQELGRTVRYETSMSMRESELVILLTGAKFKSEAEFDIHVGEARRAGISWEVIEAIPRGVLLSEEGEGQEVSKSEEFSLEQVKKSVIPSLEKEHEKVKLDYSEEATISKAKERELAIVLFTAELLDKNTVSDETYEATKKVLGGNESVLVEITAIIGYYAYVGYTLNVFRVAASPSSVVSPGEG